MSWNDIFTKQQDDGTVSTDAHVEDLPVDTAENTPEYTDPVETPAADEPVADGEPSSSDRLLSDSLIHMRLNSNGDVGKAAVYLALSEYIAEERHIKDTLAAIGWRSVATEVGGLSGDLSMKVSRALVGAALNSGVVRKNTGEMHALMHAAQEAFSTFIPFGLLQTSIGAKIAIVRNSQWIAVAVAGDTAFHAIAHHERLGVGVMHI